MTAHVSEELPRLLTGEAPRDVVLAAASHLRTCVDCQQELVQAVVAHASLTSAHRFAPEILSDQPTENADTTDVPGREKPLPDLSAMFAQVRDEATAPTRLHASRRVRYGLVAAAAAVVVGGGSYAVITNTGGSDSGTSTQTVALQAFDAGKTPATVTVRSGGRMDIDAASLPNLDSQHYEVWLTDERRTDMQPIGWIGSDGKATLTVPGNLMKKFSDIEVSVQDLGKNNYSYSGTSVLRGAYTLI